MERFGLLKTCVGIDVVVAPLKNGLEFMRPHQIRP